MLSAKGSSQPRIKPVSLTSLALAGSSLPAEPVPDKHHSPSVSMNLATLGCVEILFIYVVFL